MIVFTGIFKSIGGTAMTNKIKQILQISIIISILNIGLISCTPVTGTPNTYTTPTIEQPNQPQQEYVWKFISYDNECELIIKTLNKDTWMGTWEIGPKDTPHETRYFRLVDVEGYGAPTDFQPIDENGNITYPAYGIITSTQIEGHYYQHMREKFVELLK